jgi:hypothetical protein
MALEVIVPLVMLATLAAWIWAISDMARRSPLEWQASGQSPVVWTLVVVVLGVIGLVLYLSIARPRLRNAAPH